MAVKTTAPDNSLGGKTGGSDAANIPANNPSLIKPVVVIAPKDFTQKTGKV